MAKCEPGSEIYTDCINALQSVEEIGRLTLDDARAVGNTSQLAVGHGRQAGGRQGQGGRQSSQRHTSSRPPTSGQRHTPVPTSSPRPTSSQRPASGPRQTPVPASNRCQTPVPASSRRQTPVPASSRRQTPVPTSSRPHTPMPTSSRRHTSLHDHTMEEASQTTDSMSLDTTYDIGFMAHDDAGPSHTDDMRFMPTPGRPTLGAVPPEGVHTELIPPQIPTPSPEPSHIEDRPQRPQRTRTHPPDCGTGHGTIVCTHPITYTSLYN